MDDAGLRRHSLRMWAGLLAGDARGAQVTLRDGKTVGAVVRETNAEQTLFNVSRLETPLGVVPEAQLRARGVAMLRFDIHLDGIEPVAAPAAQVGQSSVPR
ncbi:hypothetical protein HK105_200919 [Polyrhizophydium stewartii]|uniref:Uncharacterized protein n=1 Tax=Polyrhizophydium stewartii TaxID=2732419 RepID=A0ABR4NII8_9FUNG